MCSMPPAALGLQSVFGVSADPRMVQRNPLGCTHTADVPVQIQQVLPGYAALPFNPVNAAAALGPPGAGAAAQFPFTLDPSGACLPAPAAPAPPPEPAALNLEQLMLQASGKPARPPKPQQVHATVFFAGVTPIVTSETLLTLFAQFGRVCELNLFRPYRGCRTSKGCGLVVFSTRQEAAAAMEALHGKFVWPGARSAMVIEWCDPDKQHKKRRAQPLTHSLLQQLVALQQAQASLLPSLLCSAPMTLGGPSQPVPFMLGH